MEKVVNGRICWVYELLIADGYTHGAYVKHISLASIT
jgi:hypothetical protein